MTQKSLLILMKKNTDAENSDSENSNEKNSDEENSDEENSDERNFKNTPTVKLISKAYKRN